MRREAKVRAATLLDLLPIGQLAERYNVATQGMKGHPLDIPTFMQNIAMSLVIPTGYASVLIVDGKMVGAFWGCLTNMPWSVTKIAQDICFFVDDGARGHGLMLIRDWVRWAKAQGAHEVCLSSASGIDTDRTNELFRKQGFTLQGESYSKEFK